MTWEPDPIFRKALIKDLKDLRNDAKILDAEIDDDFDGIEVRLRVHNDEPQLLDGDACYDTDHRGYWGAGNVSPYDSDDDLERTAEQLIEEVLIAQVETGDP